MDGDMEALMALQALAMVFGDEASDTDGEYEGPRDKKGLPHGEGRLRTRKRTFAGRFAHGALRGPGTATLAAGETVTVSAVAEEMPQGPCTLTADGMRVEGTMKDGAWHGRWTQYDGDDDVRAAVLRATYRDGERAGPSEAVDEWGGRVVLDERGEGEAPGAYIYPDRTTCLVGTFRGGALVDGRQGYLQTPWGTADGYLWSAPLSQLLRVQSPQAEHIVRGQGMLVPREPSTATAFGSRPGVPDLYEADRVEARASSLPGAGDGVFARRALGAGEIVAFYNGLRVPLSAVEKRSWAGKSYVVNLSSRVGLDVPPGEKSQGYAATKGHKFNHQRPENAEFVVGFEHPRFGEIIAIRTLAPVAAGAELFLDYNYKPSNEPPWFAAVRAADGARLREAKRVQKGAISKPKRGTPKRGTPKRGTPKAKGG